MCIYCGTNNYRKIYENHHGPILREPGGRSYEVHHLDGNHKNNDPSNLTIVTLQEHYDIHYAQGDWHACLLMSDRMKISPEEKSRLCSIATREMFKKGDHPFLDGVMSKKIQKQRIEDGTHHMLGGKIQRSTQQRLVKEGKNNFQGKTLTSKQLAEGRHVSQIKMCCMDCRGEYHAGNFGRDHKIRCKKMSKQVT